MMDANLRPAYVMDVMHSASDGDVSWVRTSGPHL
jgi:hypothetical protein